MKILDWEIVGRYFDGECTAEEVQLVEEWLEDAETCSEIELARKIWHVPANNLPKPDLETALYNVRKKINNANPTKSGVRIIDISQVSPEPEGRKSYKTFLRVAAMFLVAALAVYFVTKDSFIGPIQTISVAYQLQQKIDLPDGSMVTLDAGSEFSYPEEFSDEREVYLKGEAFFEVAHNAEKPFIVCTDKAIVKVLGTEFNVRSWQGNEKITVAVADGKVSFRNADKSDEVFIMKGQVSSIIGDNIPSIPEAADITRHLSWRTKEIGFQSTPLNEVLSQLERWYGLSFVLPDNSFGSDKITIYIENRPIEEVLELLSAVMNFSYTLTNNKVQFTQNN